jgi:small subunit ribosomal protein S8
MDPINDLFNRIKNAQAVNKIATFAPYSKLKERILQILKDNGFILDYKIRKVDNKKTLKIYLKYDENNQGAIKGIKQISKPGRKVYQKAKEIKRVKSGYGIAIISTSKGLITDKEARKYKVGGEVIAYIW